MLVAVAYMGLSEEEALEQIRTTDLTETCAYVGLLDIGKSINISRPT